MPTPSAAPYIMAGIRTAAVWTIGAATLSTTIGQASLGDPIFAGLQTQNWALVLAGCIASAALALVADLLLGTIERGFAARRKLLVWGGAALALLGIAAAGYAQLDLGKRGDTVVIGAKSFSEQYILARLIGQRLRDAGYSVEYRDGLGSAVVHDAVATGAIDISVDYTGTLWTNEMKREGNPGREAIYQTIVAWEREANGIRVLGRLGFENAYALAMREDRARTGRPIAGRPGADCTPAHRGRRSGILPPPRMVCGPRGIRCALRPPVDLHSYVHVQRAAIRRWFPQKLPSIRARGSNTVRLV